MKNNSIKLFLSIALIANISACGFGSKQETKTEQSANEKANEFQCTMKCEGEKTYNKSGSCPVCKMDLKPVVLSVNDTTSVEKTDSLEYQK